MRIAATVLPIMRGAAFVEIASRLGGLPAARFRQRKPRGDVSNFNCYGCGLEAALDRAFRLPAGSPRTPALAVRQATSLANCSLGKRREQTGRRRRCFYNHPSTGVRHGTARDSRWASGIGADNNGMRHVRQPVRLLRANPIGQRVRRLWSMRSDGPGGFRLVAHAGLRLRPSATDAAPRPHG